MAAPAAAGSGGPVPKRSRRHAEAYDIAILVSPLEPELRRQIHGCMCDVYRGHFATNGFGETFLATMAAPGSLYALATAEGSVVSTGMICWDGSVGLLGGVCTRPEHQRRGLSRALMTSLVGEVSDRADAPRWLLLGTGSRGAAKVYASLGFRGLAGSLHGGAKGYNPDDEGEWMMLRDAEQAEPVDIASEAACANVPFDLEGYVAPGPVVVEALRQCHWGAATLLMNIAEGRDKLRSFGIDEGLNAEVRLAKAFWDGDRVTVAVHGATRRILGMAFHDSDTGLEVYSVGPPSIAAALVAGVPSALPIARTSEWMTFWEKGYMIFPGLLADKAAEIRTTMDAVMAAGAAQGTSDWNAVNSGGAEFVLQEHKAEFEKEVKTMAAKQLKDYLVDADGKPVPGRILKVQAAALASSSVLDVFRTPEVLKKVRCLFSVLGQEVPEHVDVFGTKFFPMWPGGTSVSWHQDCHYFGTASPRIVSCGIYWEDTDRENGCLRVVPGSHTRGVFPHAPGVGQWAQGEWVQMDSSAGVDVVMPAGSVVLFNAMLLHAAHRNSHSERTRYSMFGHFVPASLNFGWRGTDFSHGVYADRHVVY